MTVVVIMGVSGCGKTTVATGIAKATKWVLLEGDAFHSASNIAKMKAGIPLNDEDRWPWLQAIADRATAEEDTGKSVVVACSALKRAYRDVLIGRRRNAVLIYLRGSKDLIAARLRARQDHFMPQALLDSQFATLEEPLADEHPVVIDITVPQAEEIRVAVSRILERST